MGYQKSYIGITWFSDSVETGIFVAEHEGWVKKGCKFVKKKTYYMYHKTRTCFKELKWNS